MAKILDTHEWICNYCNKYYQHPIVLPCGETMCNSHVLEIENHLSYNSNEFECKFCREKHNIPKEGFKLNKALFKIMNVNMHLCPNHKKVKTKLDEINEIVNDYETGDLINADNYLFEFFSILKNQLDLQKEIAISQITKSYDESFARLQSFEKECKQNSSKVNRLHLAGLKNTLIKKWNDQLRTPNLDKQKLDDVSLEIDSSMFSVKSKLNNYKSNLLMNKQCQFEPSNHSNCFGNLIIRDLKDRKISSDFGQNVLTLKGHHDWVTSVQVIESKNIIISGSSDNRIKIWSLRTGDCMKTLRKHTDHISSLLLISNDLLISASYDETIRLWTLVDDEEDYLNINRINLDDACTCLCNLNENFVCCGLADGSICLLDVIKFSTIESSLFREHKNKVNCVIKLSASLIATASNDTTINIIKYNNEKFKLVKILKGHESSVLSLLINQKEIDTIFSGSRDKTIKLWNIKNGVMLKSFNMGFPVLTLKQLSMTMLIVGLASDNQNILLYDTDRHKYIRTLNAHIKYVEGIELLSNDLGKFISFSTDNTIKIWKI